MLPVELLSILWAKGMTLVQTDLQFFESAWSLVGFGVFDTTPRLIKGGDTNTISRNRQQQNPTLTLVESHASFSLAPHFLMPFFYNMTRRCTLDIVKDLLKI